MSHRFIATNHSGAGWSVLFGKHHKSGSGDGKCVWGFNWAAVSCCASFQWKLSCWNLCLHNSPAKLKLRNETQYRRLYDELTCSNRASAGTLSLGARVRECTYEAVYPHVHQCTPLRPLICKWKHLHFIACSLWRHGNFGALRKWLTNCR